MAASKPKVIYISGIGRSGSTLLDALIATSDKVFSVGEAYRFNELREIDTWCSCGATFSTCPFWQQFKDVECTIINRMNVRDYFKFALFLFIPFRKRLRFRNTSGDAAFFRAVQERLPENIVYIMDASKDVARLAELEQSGELDVYPIAIVRDGRAVAHSFTHNTRGRSKNYFVSLAKWMLVNTLMFRYFRKVPRRRLVIDYGELCRRPDTVLARVEEYLDISLPDDYIDIIRTMDYHHIGGNRLAAKDRREKMTALTYDDRWRREQPCLTRFVASVLAYPFLRRWMKQ
ncbi:MAG: hypothetical protein U9Q79_00430 [Candidatus Hydrogenedentes bacterium]|nr:hypothetical protein [Candidatus Hydrogenedentota bacterium]